MKKKALTAFGFSAEGIFDFCVRGTTSMPQWHCVYRYLEMIPIAPKRDKLCLHCHDRDIHECLLINVLERRPLQRKEDRTKQKQNKTNKTNDYAYFQTSSVFPFVWKPALMAYGLYVSRLYWSGNPDFLLFFLTISAPDLSSEQAIKKEPETQGSNGE